MGNFRYILSALIISFLGFSHLWGQECSNDSIFGLPKEWYDSIQHEIDKKWEETYDVIRSVQIKSICGIEFGCTKEEALNSLYNKFGLNFRKINNNHVCFLNKRYAGFDFDDIHFIFQEDDNRTYFSACIFAINTNTLERAKKIQMELANKLAEKYGISFSDQETDSPVFFGGVSPLWNEKISIKDLFTRYHGFHSDIIALESTIFKYSVRLIYGPYEFIKEEF